VNKQYFPPVSSLSTHIVSRDVNISFFFKGCPLLPLFTHDVFQAAFSLYINENSPFSQIHRHDEEDEKVSSKLCGKAACHQNFLGIGFPPIHKKGVFQYAYRL